VSRTSLRGRAGRASRGDRVSRASRGDRVGRAPLPAGVGRGAPVTISVDGAPLQAHLGESVAAALIADGEVALRTSRGGSARGLFCGMGVCFECLVMVDGVPNTRACMTWVQDGMEIRHMNGLVATEPTKESD
jgi:D-hydroxyproline dehydrogenase subunit gamma